MKWDYKMVLIRDQIDPEKMTDELKKLGLDGWEAVGIAPRFSSPQYLALLKKARQEDVGV